MVSCRQAGSRKRQRSTGGWQIIRGWCGLQ